jgi:hypothetical protein
MERDWTVGYVFGMGALVAGGFWLAAFLLTADAGSAGATTSAAADGVGLFALGVSLVAATILLATVG